MYGCITEAPDPRGSILQQRVCLQRQNEPEKECIYLMIFSLKICYKQYILRCEGFSRPYYTLTEESNRDTTSLLKEEEESMVHMHHFQHKGWTSSLWNWGTAPSWCWMCLPAWKLSKPPIYYWDFKETSSCRHGQLLTPCPAPPHSVDDGQAAEDSKSLIMV